MASRFLHTLAIVLFGLSSVSAAERLILASKQPSAELEKLSECVRIREPHAILPDHDHTSPYFVRVTRHEHIFTNNRVKAEATLGGRPFVFLTKAECIQGRNLQEIYQGIGYEAENILAEEINKETVAIVFRYPTDITNSKERTGRLPETLRSHVYVPTWDNMFSLFERLTTERDRPDAQFRLKLTDSDAHFILSFPEEGKQNVKETAYATLLANRGADWKYRELLEKSLSLKEHFRGDGYTHDEVSHQTGTDANSLIEFVGPNYRLADLPEWSIVYLGRLAVQESYTPAIQPAPAIAKAPQEASNR